MSCLAPLYVRHLHGPGPFFSNGSRVVCLAWLTVLAASGIATTVRAQTFRIETKVFLGDEAEPVSHNTTLFENGVVYDFLGEPQQVAVFRKPAAERPGRFILLDTQRQLRTELNTEQIQQVLEKVRSWASSHQDPFFRFTARPDFQESFDSKTGRLSLNSSMLSYHIETGERRDAALMADYLRFCDWYARLNAVVAGQMLPFPRLAANAALAKHNRVPKSVLLSIPGEDLKIRAQHRFDWRLSKQDRTRIEEVLKQLQSFRQVSNAEYRAAPVDAAGG